MFSSKKHATSISLFLMQSKQAQLNLKQQPFIIYKSPWVSWAVLMGPESTDVDQMGWLAALFSTMASAGTTQLCSTSSDSLKQRLQTFSAKGQIVSMVSTTTTQLYGCSVKTAINSTLTKEHAHVPIKLYININFKQLI